MESTRKLYPIKVRYFYLEQENSIFSLQPVKIQNTTIHYIIVLMKYFIFNMKCRTVYPTFDIFKKMPKMKLDMEKEIAVMNDKIGTNRLNWTNFIYY